MALVDRTRLPGKPSLSTVGAGTVIAADEMVEDDVLDEAVWMGGRVAYSLEVVPIGIFLMWLIMLPPGEHEGSILKMRYINPCLLPSHRIDTVRRSGDRGDMHPNSGL